MLIRKRSVKRKTEKLEKLNERLRELEYTLWHVLLRLIYGGGYRGFSELISNKEINRLLKEIRKIKSKLTKSSINIEAYFKEFIKASLSKLCEYVNRVGRVSIQDLVRRQSSFLTCREELDEIEIGRIISFCINEGFIDGYILLDRELIITKWRVKRDIITYISLHDRESI